MLDGGPNEFNVRRMLAEQSGEAPPEFEGQSIVPLRDGRLAPRWSSRTFRDEWRGLEVSVEGEIRDGDVVCVGLKIIVRDDGAIAKQDLRDLPLARFLALTVAPWVFVREAEVVHTFGENVTEVAETLPRRKRRIGDDHLREVADVYRQAVTEGRRNPTKAVGEELGLNRSTAGKHVQRARERDFLGPAPGPMRAGEVAETPKPARAARAPKKGSKR